MYKGAEKLTTKKEDYCVNQTNVFNFVYFKE